MDTKTDLNKCNEEMKNAILVRSPNKDSSLTEYSECEVQANIESVELVSSEDDLNALKFSDYYDSLPGCLMTSSNNKDDKLFDKTSQYDINKMLCSSDYENNSPECSSTFLDSTKMDTEQLTEVSYTLKDLIGELTDLVSCEKTLEISQTPKFDVGSFFKNLKTSYAENQEDLESSKINDKNEKIINFFAELENSLQNQNSKKTVPGDQNLISITPERKLTFCEDNAISFYDDAIKFELDKKLHDDSEDSETPVNSDDSDTPVDSDNSSDPKISNDVSGNRKPDSAPSSKPNRLGSSNSNVSKSINSSHTDDVQGTPNNHPENFEISYLEGNQIIDPQSIKKFDQGHIQNSNPESLEICEIGHSDICDTESSEGSATESPLSDEQQNTIGSDTESAGSSDPENCKNSDVHNSEGSDPQSSDGFEQQSSDDCEPESSVSSDQENHESSDPLSSDGFEQQSSEDGEPESLGSSDIESLHSNDKESLENSVPESRESSDPQSSEDGDPQNSVEGDLQNSVDSDPQNSVEGDPQSSENSDSQSSEGCDPQSSENGDPQCPENNYPESPQRDMQDGETTVVDQQSCINRKSKKIIDDVDDLNQEEQESSENKWMMGKCSFQVLNFFRDIYNSLFGNFQRYLNSFINITKRKVWFDDTLSDTEESKSEASETESVSSCTDNDEELSTDSDEFNQLKTLYSVRDITNFHTLFLHLRATAGTDVTADQVKEHINGKIVLQLYNGFHAMRSEEYDDLKDIEKIIKDNLVTCQNIILRSHDICSRIRIILPKQAHTKEELQILNKDLKLLAGKVVKHMGKIEHLLSGLIKSHENFKESNDFLVEDLSGFLTNDFACIFKWF